MTITLYTTHCTQCTILEKKLKDKKIEYKTIDGKNAVKSIMAQGYMSAPMLEVDGKFMEYGEAVRWVNERSGE